MDFYAGLRKTKQPNKQKKPQEFNYCVDNVWYQTPPRSPPFAQTLFSMLIKFHQKYWDIKLQKESDTDLDTVDAVIYQVRDTLCSAESCPHALLLAIPQVKGFRNVSLRRWLCGWALGTLLWVLASLWPYGETWREKSWWMSSKTSPECTL